MMCWGCKRPDAAVGVLHREAHPELVVGVDVCGDPHKPTVTPFLIPALKDGPCHGSEATEPA